MKSVLLITDVSFWMKSSGHRVRISKLIEFLAQESNLTVVFTGPLFNEFNFESYIAVKAQFHILEKEKYLDSNGYGRKLKKYLEGKDFEIVIIEYIHSSYFLNYINKKTTFVLDMHDLISERTKDFATFNFSGHSFELSRDKEAEIMKFYDYVLVLNYPDLKEVQKMIGFEKPLLCPHPVEPVCTKIRERVKTIGFIASEYLPNKDAICNFLTKCWPLITVTCPVRLLLFGTISNVLTFPLPDNVFSKGYVSKTDEMYDEIDIVINPVRFGAGLKIKNIEALAYGKPLITTTHGARGIESGKDKAFLIADEPQDFIQQIFSLVNNFQKREKLSEGAHAFIKENYCLKKCYSPLLNLLNTSNYTLNC